MVEQNTPQWHELRRTKIGASDAPIIMGVSPWKTAFQLWEEKVFGKEQETSPAMERGIALEGSARERFQDKFGILMMPKVVIHPERLWQMASLDGISFEGTMILEIKHANREVFEMAIQGKLPDYYMYQVQHALDVTGAAKCYYMVCHSDRDVYVEVFPDLMMIADMRSKTSKFHEYMMSKEAPPLTDKDYVVMNDKKWEELVKEYKDIKDQLHILLQSEEYVKDELKKLAGNRNAMGAGAKLTKSVCKGRVDYDAIPELMGVNIEPYRKAPCEKWKVSFTTKDEA